MSNRTDKFAEKAKTSTMVIDGEKGIVHDSAEWHFYFWKNQYFNFLLSLIEGRETNLENPLDARDWDRFPKPDAEFDENACAEYYLKNKKCEAWLRKVGYMGLHPQVYKLQARDYERSLMHPQSKGVYKSKLSSSGWTDPETGLFPDEKADGACVARIQNK